MPGDVELLGSAENHVKTRARAPRKSAWLRRRARSLASSTPSSPPWSHSSSSHFIYIHVKMKLAITALLAGSAAAFAPAQTGRVATDLAVSELELGVTEPLGVYDPLGWLETQPESFERRRAVERKHGRVAMAAVVGTIVHNNHIVFDGYLSKSADLKFSDVPTGIDGIRAIP